MEGDVIVAAALNLGIISIHSLRMEGDTWQQGEQLSYFSISIHSLRMEGDNKHPGWRAGENLISIHSLRMEGDVREMFFRGYVKTFQSTPSAWRETLTGTKNDGFMLVFQSTPSAWRETQGRPAAYRRSFISIHSLRMEGDFFKGVMTWENVGISIHSLRMEGDLFNTALADQPIIFQSTPSAWRETERSHPANGEPAYFNPLPPHGGRHQWAVTFG